MYAVLATFYVTLLILRLLNRNIFWSTKFQILWMLVDNTFLIHALLYGIALFLVILLLWLARTLIEHQVTKITFLINA